MNQEVKKILEDKFYYDFDSEIFTDEVLTIIDETIQATTLQLLQPDVIKSLPDYDSYIVTTEDSEESHFVNSDLKESAIETYKTWSRGYSVMAQNTRIYKVVDITEDVKVNVL